MLLLSFPISVVSLKQEMKQKQKAQEELSARTQPLPLPDVVPDGDPQHAHYGLPALNGGPVPLGGANPAPGMQQANRNHGLLGGALANLFVIVGFAAFAYTVKYVLRSIAQEWERKVVVLGDASPSPHEGEPASGLIWQKTLCGGGMLGSAFSPFTTTTTTTTMDFGRRKYKAIPPEEGVGVGGGVGGSGGQTRGLDWAY